MNATTCDAVRMTVLQLQAATLDQIASSMPGSRRRTISNCLTRLLKRGHLAATGPVGRLIYQPTTRGRSTLRPAKRVRALSEAETARLVRMRLEAQRPPSLQPIWPAVAGAPIGGLRPCIA